MNPLVAELWNYKLNLGFNFKNLNKVIIKQRVFAYNYIENKSYIVDRWFFFCSYIGYFCHSVTNSLIFQYCDAIMKVGFKHYIVYISVSRFFETILLRVLTFDFYIVFFYFIRTDYNGLEVEVVFSKKCTLLFHLKTLYFFLLTVNLCILKKLIECTLYKFGELIKTIIK